MAYLRVIDLNNRNEADVISSILKDNNISYSLHCLEDSAFDGLFTGHMIWGFIEVDEEQKDLAIQLHQEYLASKSIEVIPEKNYEEHSKKASPPAWINLLLASLFFVSTIAFLFLFLSSNEKLSRINKSMSVSYSWDRANRILTETSKRTGKVVAKVYDLKHDGKYSKRVTYAENGKTYMEYYDNDENGIYETGQKYKSDGTLLYSDEVSNIDGSLEFQTVHFPNGATIKYKTDPNSELQLSGIYTSAKGERRIIDLANGTINPDSNK